MNKQPQAQTNYSNPLIIALLLGISFIFLSLIIISVAELSNRETTLLGTVLTLISVGIGWGISHHYSTEDKNQAVAEIRDFEQKNLRTYALKAAEKVTNLSKELNRLSLYLEEELQYTSYRNSDEELFAKEERIESAIHMLESLRSINDTSLSDWQGVIGEELDEQREIANEQAEALKALTDRISIIEGANDSSLSLNRETQEIEDLKKQIRSLATEISGPSFRKKQRPTYNQIADICPSCNGVIHYAQRDKHGDQKAVQCKACGINLISIYNENNGFELRTRKKIEELISCPSCHKESTHQLDEWPTASTTVVCDTCRAQLRLSRVEDGRKIKATTINPVKSIGDKVTPEFIESVRNLLPPQPWPKGIHHEIALKLDARSTMVQKAIQQLIKSGIFQDQIDGVNCTTEEKLKIIRLLKNEH